MKKYRLVIVENDQDEQFFMKEGIKESGLFELLAIVRNGNILFEWLHENKNNLPELILSDLNMPGKNGYDLLAELKATSEYEDIPVVITSTAATTATVQKCHALGASGYLVKPETFINYASFLKELHQLIEQKNLVK
jgi:CheY-like chemotaxis protein